MSPFASTLTRWGSSLGLVLVLLCLTPQTARAGYYQWDSVTLPLVSGASCGNGTPYRFFVNRAWRAKDAVVVLEGGGACWDQASCEGQGPLSAANPEGIPTDYMRSASPAAYGLITPFISRLSVLERVRTQGWNMVYLPYCTGDAHTGSQVQIYDDARPESPRVQYHRGQANLRAAAAWIGSNLRTRELLITGFSAGAVGATAGYPILRDAIAPTGRATLLSDSGPLFSAPHQADPALFPSSPLHQRIRAAWGLQAEDGIVPTSLASLPGFNPDDLGTVPGALALRYPQDRFAYMSFIRDATFSAFSYAKFDPAIAAAPDEASRLPLLLAPWERDVERWVSTMTPYGNVSWHLPYFRNFAGSHCLTLVDFSGTGIEEVGLNSIQPFINNALDRGEPMRHVETDRLSDLLRPLGDGLRRLMAVLRLFGIEA